MNMTSWILIGVAIAVAIVGGAIYYRRRQKEMFQGFEQISLTLRQVPKQKKQAFILLMFRESVKAGKNKNVNLQAKMNDPKYLEVQLLQMGSILKDRTKVTDKKMKQALQMYDAFLLWEKNKHKPA